MEELTQQQKRLSSFSALPLAAKTLAFASLALAGYGVFVAYSYRGIDKVVGGDAFNFIILGLRGLIWVGIGAIAAIFAAALAVIATRE